MQKHLLSHNKFLSHAEILSDLFSTSSSKSRNESLSHELTTTISQSTFERVRKDFVTPNWVAVFDRFQISVRNFVYVLKVALEAMDVKADEFPGNKSSIHRTRAQTLQIEQKF